VKPLIVFCVILNISASSRYTPEVLQLICQSAIDLSAQHCEDVTKSCVTSTARLRVHASIRAAPEEVLTLMSLLKSGLLWTRFGDQLAITY
jgi:hypothetical protein